MNDNDKMSRFFVCVFSGDFSCGSKATPASCDSATV